jgi:hypothetical protein
MRSVEGHVEAVKKYFSVGASRPVGNQEILALRLAITKEEWERLANECRSLNVKLHNS